VTKNFVAVLARIDAKVIEGPLEEWEHRYLALSPLERDLYDVNCFQFECVCGGLGTYFTNSAGRHWNETLRALQRIRAHAAYETLRQACALFPGGSPSADLADFERQANDAKLQARINAVPELDDEELMDTLEEYWRAQTGIS
jgi:hypothetical protein